MMTRCLKSFVFIIPFALILWSCGNKGTGVEPGEPPEIPEISAAQPDFSYFENAQKLDNILQSEHAFVTASSTAMSARLLFSFGQLSTTYFEMAKQEQAVFKDGQWEWNYSASYEGQSVEFRLTATVDEDANEASWEFYISSSGGGQEVDNFKFMEGTTSLDGKKGDWKVYDYTGSTSSTPVMTYEWSIDSDGNMTATFNFSNGDSISVISYVQDGDAHTLSMSGSSIDTVLYWDTKNDHGYWWDKVEGQKLCWTSNKTDIACSEIGF